MLSTLITEELARSAYPHAWGEQRSTLASERPVWRPRERATPVFYDESRWRWRWFNLLKITLLALLVVAVVTFTTSLFAAPRLPPRLLSRAADARARAAARAARIQVSDEPPLHGWQIWVPKQAGGGQ